MNGLKEPVTNSAPRSQFIHRSTEHNHLIELIGLGVDCLKRSQMARQIVLHDETVMKVGEWLPQRVATEY